MICHEKMTYTNCKGESIVFGSDGLYLNEVALNWKYDMNSTGNRITSFSLGINSFPLSAQIICDSDDEANSIRDRLHDVFFYDVAHNKKGKLYYRDYVLNCNINESKNSEYQEHVAFGDIELTVSTDRPYWIKKTKHSFVFSSEGSATSGGIDFPYDYEFDYKLIQNSAFFENDVFSDCDFIMQIQGVVSSPTVYISGYMYGVDVTLSRGDTLIIDSLEKKITLHTSSGDSINCFNSRKRESNVFSPLPTGQLRIETSQQLSIELTCIEKRGEPRWT